jgi:hypothetical protein
MVVGIASMEVFPTEPNERFAVTPLSGVASSVSTLRRRVGLPRIEGVCLRTLPKLDVRRLFR